MSKWTKAGGEGWLKYFVGEYLSTPPVLATGERNMVQMDAAGRLMMAGKLHKLISVAPTVTAGAYTANWVLGGKMTFANALRAPSLSGVLKSIHVNTKSGAALGTVSFYLFKADPSASTVADGAAISVHANDFDKLIGIYALGAVAGVGAKIALLDNIGKAIEAASTSLYGVMTVSGTPTPGSTADIKASLGIEQD